jgi:hypothetical protein
LWPEDLEKLEDVLNDFDNSVKITFHAITDVDGRAREHDTTSKAIDHFYKIEERMREVVEKIERTKV